MGFDTITTAGQETKDNIGARDSTRDILLDRNNEQILIEENSTIVKKNTIGLSFILGHSTNGKLGTQGTQPVLGESSRVLTLEKVVNPNNTYREHFRDNTFESAATTAVWNTTLFRISMSTSTDHLGVETTNATSKEIFKDGKTITKALFNATETKFGSDSIVYALSADNGDNWENVTLGETYTFTNTGTTLLFKVAFIGNGGVDTYVEDIVISYVAS